MTQPVTPSEQPPSPRQAVVTSVVWQNVLEFTHLFRGFRLAANPAKLGMALLAILLMYAAGRAFDAAWGLQSYPDELQRFSTEPAEHYRSMRASREDARAWELGRLLEQARADDASLTASRITQLKTDPAGAYAALKTAYESQFARAVSDAATARVAAEKMGDASAADQERAAQARAAASLLASVQRARQAAGRGIFDAFLRFELGQFDQLVDNTLAVVRVGPPRPSGGLDSPGIEGQPVTGGLVTRDPSGWRRSDTIAGCLVNMVITGPQWLFTGTAPMQWRPERADTWGGWFTMVGYRALYLASLVLLSVFSMAVLALAGGSIARLSALELGGNDRPPLKDVVRFAIRRLGAFVQAPLMPLGILLVAGAVMAVGGLVGAIPWVGEILLGLFFVLFLSGGFVLMLLLLGIVGGFNLLYPTIAVEGADAFDAMSRSFAYAYARPWRLLWFTLVSLVYGVITLLFVSLAVYVILLLTHTFAGWGVNLFGSHYGAYSGVSKLDTLWPAPQFGHLIAPINWYAMSGPEFVGALCLHFWVFMLIAWIGAYAISYYFSSHTIMYLLLRRSVDGQGIREVYIEESA